MSSIQDDNGFYYGIADYAFKNILFGKEDKLTKWFLSKILSIDIFTFELKNTVFPKETSENKTQNLDIVVIVNNHILIDIEANSHYYESLHNRNFGYAMTLYKRYIVDEDSKRADQIILIDFTRGVKNKYELVTNLSHLQTVKYEKYVQDFETLTFNLDKALEYWYHKDTEMICKYFYLIMLMLNEKDLYLLCQTKGISDKDKIYLNRYREDLTKMNEKYLDMRMWQDRYDIYLSDIRAQKRHAAETGRAEGHAEGLAAGLAKGHASGHAAGLAEGRAEGRAEGLTQGIEQNKIENARKMLLDNVSLDLVKKYTDLPLPKIRELQKSLANS